MKKREKSFYGLEGTGFKAPLEPTYVLSLLGRTEDKILNSALASGKYAFAWRRKNFIGCRTYPACGVGGRRRGDLNIPKEISRCRMIAFVIDVPCRIENVPSQMLPGDGPAGRRDWDY